MKAFFCMGMGLISLFLSIPLRSQDCQPVSELKTLYKTNNDFRKTVDNMFTNIKPLGDGSNNPWMNKDVNDLYAFLNEWFYFLPNAHNGLDRIMQFTFLYYKNPAGQKFILEEPGKSWAISFVIERGKFMDSPESTRIIEEWLKDPDLGNEEFVYPENGFQSFNHFFTRDLKPGTRPIDKPTDNAVLVSPADGIINMINNSLELNTEISTKNGMTLTLNALLDSSQFASEFVGGTALAVFLLPHNYHHYHAPISGNIIESRETVGDRLFGMNDIVDFINNGNVAYNKDYSIFQQFKHGYIIIETKLYGKVAMIPIGLQTVGSVVFEDKFKSVSPQNPEPVNKGEKLGHFRYGGSTVLLIFQRGKFSSLNVKQGQQIGVMEK